MDSTEQSRSEPPVPEINGIRSNRAVSIALVLSAFFAYEIGRSLCFDQIKETDPALAAAMGRGADSVRFPDQPKKMPENGELECGVSEVPECAFPEVPDNFSPEDGAVLDMGPAVALPAQSLSVDAIVRAFGGLDQEGGESESSHF